jgi:hypothetical protein
MNNVPRRLAVILLFLTAVSIAGSSVLAAAKSARLTIVDEQGASHEVSLDDLGKLPRKSVKVAAAEKKPAAEYEGVPLRDVLQHFGVVLGKDLRGPRVASYVVVEAEDGYRIVLALAELDPATTDKIVLLADHRDGSEMRGKEGPFRLVIPDEKRQVRWIRMIKRISVHRAAAD